MSSPTGIKVTEHLDPIQDITAEWASIQMRLREDVLEEARFLMSRQCTELRMFAEKLREVMVEEMRGVLSRPPPSPSGRFHPPPLSVV